MCYYWVWLKLTGIFFLKEKMTIIFDNWTKSRISTFSGETAIYNADNTLFPMPICYQKFNLTRRSLRIIGSGLKCFQYNKGVYCCCPTIVTMSMKPIQSPSAPLKPREYSDHHEVRILTLTCNRWNLTTEKLITPRFESIFLMQIDYLENVCSFLLVLIQCNY